MEDQQTKPESNHPITEALHQVVDTLNPLFVKVSETKEQVLNNLRSIGNHSRPLPLPETI